MVITTTAVAFILLSVGLALCGWRFVRTFKADNIPKERLKIRLLISFSFAGFSVQNGILGFGMLFLAQSTSGLFWMLVGAVVSLALVAILSSYTIYYLFFPRHSPIPAIILVCIVGVIDTIGTFIIHPHPFITSENGIDWNLPFLLSSLTFTLLLFSISSQFYIFKRLYSETHNREIKVLSLILSTAAAVGIIDTFARFMLLRNVESGKVGQLLDIGIALIGLIYVVSVLVPRFFDRYNDTPP